MKKLILQDVRVESFATTQAEPERPGTVRAYATTQVYCGCNNSIDTCNGPSCVYGTCDPGQCDTESMQPKTCDFTCGNNYGCDSVDPRCTHGGVYMC